MSPYSASVPAQIPVTVVVVPVVTFSIHPHPAQFHCVPSYVFNVSVVVSYHMSH